MQVGELLHYAKYTSQSVLNLLMGAGNPCQNPPCTRDLQAVVLCLWVKALTCWMMLWELIKNKCYGLQSSVHSILIVRVPCSGVVWKFEMVPFNYAPFKTCWLRDVPQQEMAPD